MTQKQSRNLEIDGHYNKGCKQTETHGKKMPAQIVYSKTAPMHNVLFVQYVYLPTEQAQTYFNFLS